MIAEIKKIEFWNFLTTEKNQPRPKGITIHRLALLKPVIIGSDDLWRQVVESSGAANRSAADFYQSDERSSVDSRAAFWGAVRRLITEQENRGNKRANSPARAVNKTQTKSVSRTGRRKQY